MNEVPVLRVDGKRLVRRIEELGRVGADPGGGVSRLAFTEEYVRGRELVAGYMREAGLRPSVDAAGNLLGRQPDAPEDLPVLLLGSHIDSVPGGGTLDGAYGVLAAVEVAQVLATHGVRPAHPLAVVAFNNEEGAFGTRGMFGSRALVGGLVKGELDVPDSRGDTIAEWLPRVGGDADRVDEAAWPSGRIAAFLELHIEQGPVLHEYGDRIGVVDVITGRTSVDLDITGQTNHAGTTPMDLRRDALVAASHIIAAIPRLAGPRGVVRVATVGQCFVHPNAWNVVPGRVRLRVDLRDGSRQALTRGVAEVESVAGVMARRTGTRVEVRVGQQIPPVPCAPSLRQAIARAADELRLPHRTVPSGAGHDAQIIGEFAPMGMIFVPSRRGISHAPDEATAATDLVAGADVLLRTVLGFGRGQRAAEGTERASR
ncbi:Zn-dependent hydrolase [Streptomyces sp. 8K308]|uniref:Zn-dependent hydrolase n=1 Tax=Streptomyces sp. 8K308 TaxID=2530388 RepID=UPI001045783C|nr:Zn-dependent hydrolase [Streptomyces sp. 8K308]TDC25558.1 Zn-dependent hydrolase [Streptomyces sp. 8K308]